MSILIYSDDTYQKVPYNKAAKIYQILCGNVEPENTTQADFVSQVKDVIFEKPGGGYEPPDAKKFRELKER